MNTPLAYPFRTWCKANGISVAQGYNLLRDGRLKAHKLGTRTIILAADAETFINSLPEYQPRQAVA